MVWYVLVWSIDELFMFMFYVDVLALNFQRGAVLYYTNTAQQQSIYKMNSSNTGSTDQNRKPEPNPALPFQFVSHTHIYILCDWR